MGIYTKPDFSFIDTYMTAAKARDERSKQKQDDIIGGMANVVKGVGDAAKWQARYNIADKAEELKAKIKELEEEKAAIIGAKRYDDKNIYGQFGGKGMNFDLYTGINPLLDTGRI